MFELSVLENVHKFLITWTRNQFLNIRSRAYITSYTYQLHYDILKAGPIFEEIFSQNFHKFLEFLYSSKTFSKKKKKMGNNFLKNRPGLKVYGLYTDSRKFQNTTIS